LDLININKILHKHAEYSKERIIYEAVVESISEAPFTYAVYVMLIYSAVTVGTFPTLGIHLKFTAMVWTDSTWH